MIGNVHVVLLLRLVELVKGEVGGDDNIHVTSTRGCLTNDGQGSLYLGKNKRTLFTIGTFGFVFTLKGIIFSVGRWNPNDTHFFNFHILWLQNTTDEECVKQKSQGSIKEEN